MGSSRARVSQVMSLLNLHPEIQEYLKNAEYNLDAKPLTERRLREIAVIHDGKEPLTAFQHHTSLAIYSPDSTSDIKLGI